MALLDMEHAVQGDAAKDSTLRDWLRALEATAPVANNPQRTLPDVIEEQAQQRGSAEALISARSTLSYRALGERVNRYARWALHHQVQPGETVSLMLPNQPDYFAIWLGITKVGGVVALINTQLRGTSLAHCIDLVKPKHVIVAAELMEQFQSAQLSTQPKVWQYDGQDGLRIDSEIERFSPAPLGETERRTVTIDDQALTIYTSGTTGLPKAAKVSHRRLMQWSFWFGGLMDTGPDDRMYNCLPMYHAVGGVQAIGALLVRGGAVVIAEKFSAREFWKDIAAYDCTLFQYIGELCRYLVNAPAQPAEREHRLRLAVGNGMRADVWERFQSRFAIPRVLEFYAATEGNVSLYNVEGKPGAVGRLPAFLRHRFPLDLVKFDTASNMPLRDGEGRCIRCAADEIGEAIGRIASDAKAGGRFEGYTEAADTERKILRNVFKDGDAWYRTGDLMRVDAGGFFFFVDRIGDTFRWKGENVATSEVAAALERFPGIAEACVYGVEVHGHEGKAGMATLVTNGALDLAALRNHLAAQLPAYARPLFLRIKESITATATFKQKKDELAREGFDLATVADPIYCYCDDPQRQAYMRLDAALYESVATGTLRL
ncbi:MAG TPA: long-chain-acyl-CoA synthetase [Xanthobacteraceae bacterium]|jgi:fatty-acyl-CoA synthase|nr:long-chain-acyl-CoA synthetase [Xanthobacteraceae bacterium]